MKVIKQILAYLGWTVLALLLGITYMRVVLGQADEPSTGFLHIFDIIYDIALVYVGLIIGSIIALLFILIDAFYLKKKLKNSTKSTSIRFFMLLMITIVVGITHYVLEKVIDVI